MLYFNILNKIIEFAKKLIVKMNGGRKVSGIMIGFDHFMNIVLDR